MTFAATCFKSTRVRRTLAHPASQLLALEEGEKLFGAAVGDRESLDAQLLLGLQGLQTCRFLVHVGIDKRADAAGDVDADVRVALGWD